MQHLKVLRGFFFGNSKNIPSDLLGHIS